MKSNPTWCSTSLFISPGLWMFMLRPHLEVYSSHEPKADCCFFLGYSDDHKGFRCFSLCRRRVFISRHVTFDEATLYDPPSTVPQCQREVPHMLPTLTDSASFAPEITIRPIPTAGASFSSPPSRISLLVHILLHLLLHLMVINPLSSTTLAGLKLKLLLHTRDAHF